MTEHVLCEEATFLYLFYTMRGVCLALVCKALLWRALVCRHIVLQICGANLFLISFVIEINPKMYHLHDV